MPLLYEEKEFIHQEEIMYTVFILGLRKRNRNTFASSSLLSGKTFEDRSIRRSRGQGALKNADIVVTDLSSLQKDMSEFLRIDARLTGSCSVYLWSYIP